MKVKPLMDKVLIKRDNDSEKSKGGILLPGAAKERANTGTVVAVGPGKLLENGDRSKMQVKVGDSVIFPSYASNQTAKDGDDEYVFLNESEILGILEK